MKKALVISHHSKITLTLYKKACETFDYTTDMYSYCAPNDKYHLLYEALLKEKDYDLILLDANLGTPGGATYAQEIIKKLHKNQPHAKIIAFSQTVACRDNLNVDENFKNNNNIIGVAKDPVSAKKLIQQLIAHAQQILTQFENLSISSNPIDIGHSTASLNNTENKREQKKHKTI